MHLVITDSGLGGLSICAGLDRALRESGAGRDLRITYINAWPEEGRGYNDLPDIPARARVFDRALFRMDDMQPSLVVIACNTLSILYDRTEHRRRAGTAVLGIIDAGVELFDAALRARPAASLVLMGTRTTIESGVHRARLLERGIDPGRVTGASCHGLATAIETAPGGADTVARIATCAASAVAVAPPGNPLFVGLCCTHYSLVANRIRSAVAERSADRTVEVLDPNEPLVRALAARVTDQAASARAGDAGARPRSIEVISKVTLPESKRRSVADVLEPVSPPVAAALRSYVHVPDLF